MTGCLRCLQRWVRSAKHQERQWEAWPALRAGGGAKWPRGTELPCHTGTPHPWSALRSAQGVRDCLIALCQDVQTAGCAPAVPGHPRAESDSGRAVPSAGGNSWWIQEVHHRGGPDTQRTLYSGAAGRCRVRKSLPPLWACHCYHS